MWKAARQEWRAAPELCVYGNTVWFQPSASARFSLAMCVKHAAFKAPADELCWLFFVLSLQIIPCPVPHLDVQSRNGSVGVKIHTPEFYLRLGGSCMIKGKRGMLSNSQNTAVCQHPVNVMVRTDSTMGERCRRAVKEQTCLREPFLCFQSQS